MPVHLELKDKATGKRAHLAQEVDPAIARHMKVECDDNEWTLSWYHSIGLLMAVGKRGEELREAIRSGWKENQYRVEEMLKIADFIEENYEASSWR